MAITFDIPNTEIIITTGQTTVLCQDLLNEIRVFEDDFQMMANPKIADAEGKVPIGALFSEIILKILNPWTLRFIDEASIHTFVRGGTIVALDAVGAERPLTTNPSTTINQSVSGTLIETGVSGLTPTESAQLDNINTKTDTIQTDITTINTTLAGMNKPKKNQVFNNFMFLMVDSTDLRTPKLGLTGFTQQLVIDNGAVAAMDNAVSEIGLGLYKIDLSANDTNGDIITYIFTATGAVTRYVTIITST